MSPEQWDEIELDAKTDVYAYGVMLNEMFTGQPPPSGHGTNLRTPWQSAGRSLEVKGPGA